jgi:hypothetical protein
MNALFQKRESVYSHAKMIAAAVASGIVGLVIVFGGFVNVLFDSPIVWIVSVPATVFLITAAIWPSFRITCAGVTGFWSFPLDGLMVPLMGYFGPGVFFDVLPYLLLVIAISLPWAMLCVAFARLRLPVIYPFGCCQSCGYDLRGHRHERCPECGKAE